MGRFNIRTLCQVALLVALEIVLNRFCSINTLTLKIGFSFLPIALCGMLFGPIWAAAAGALADFLGAMLFPTAPFFPGFTITAAVMGAVFGLFLYKKDKLRFFSDIILSTLANCIICGLFINTLWISILVDSKTYWGLFIGRLTTQYVFLVPVYIVLLPLLSKLTVAVRKAGLVK